MLQGPGMFSSFDGSFDCFKGKGYRTCCVAPSYVNVLSGPVWRKQPVNCGKCKHCLWVKAQSRSNGIAFEFDGADWIVFFTATIAPDRVTSRHEDSELDIDIPQRFLKRFRINADRWKGSFDNGERKPRVAAGEAKIPARTWDIRFFQVGEHGKLKGRAHYHLVIWGKGVAPHFPPGKNIHIPEWDLGLVNVRKDIDSGVGIYLSSYMQKNDGKKFIHSQSSKFALGAQWLVDYAVKQVCEWGAPRPNDNWRVTYAMVVRKRKAVLTGAGLRDYVRAFALARKMRVLDLVPLVGEHMKQKIAAIDKWERDRIERVAIRRKLSYEEAREAVVAEFGQRFGYDFRHDEPARPPKGVWLSGRPMKFNFIGVGEPDVPVTTEVFVERFAHDIRRFDWNAEKRHRQSDDDWISRAVERGEYVPKAALPLPWIVSDPALHIPLRDADSPERRERVATLNRNRAGLVTHYFG